MTREELRDLVIEHQFSPTKYNTFVDEMLNEAQRRIARRADLRIWFTAQAITTTAGDGDSALPDDFARVYSLTDSEGTSPLWALTVPEFDDLPSSSSGRPTNYVIDRPDIKFYPTPDAAYSLQLRYYQTPTEMTADDDEPEIPEDYQHVLVSYALARCYRRENDYRAADYHLDEYKTELGELMADLQDDTQDQTQAQQVSGMWGDESQIRVP